MAILSKIKIKVLLIFLFLFSFNKYPFAQKFNWAKTFAGTSSNVSISNLTDKSGNIYSTGSFSGTVDFDPGPGINNITATGSRNTFISKIDSFGNLIWVRTTSGGYSQGISIAADTLGNIYVGGFFDDRSAVDFNPGTGVHLLSAVGLFDVFFLKLTTLGNFVWAKSIGGTGEDFLMSMVVNNSGDVFATGKFNATADFDPNSAIFNLTPSAKPYPSIFTMKLNANGSLSWANQFNGPASTYGDEGLSIELDNSSNIYSSGTVEGVTDLDPGPGVFSITPTTTSGGNNHCYICKLDSSGKFLKGAAFGNAAIMRHKFKLDHYGSIYLAGDFNAKSDFDPGPDSAILNAYYDIFVLKLDTSFNFKWVKLIYGNGNSTSRDIAVRNSGVYLVGSFDSTVDFDPSPDSAIYVSRGRSDAHILKLDTNGSFNWVYQIGGKDADAATCISVSNSYAVNANGLFFGTVDFDNGPDSVIVKTPSSSYNGFTVQMDQSGCNTIARAIIIESPACYGDTATILINGRNGEYPYTGIGTYKKVAGIYDFIVTDAKGCPDTINIIINQPDTINVNVTLKGDTIEALNKGAKYQWINCISNSIIPGEINEYFIPTLDGNYAVIVTEGTCFDTSSCTFVSKLGIDHNNHNQKPGIAPNPFNNTLSVKGLLESDKLMLFDMHGKMINLNWTNNGIERHANTTGLPGGMYILRIEDAKGLVKYKQTLQHD